MDLGRLPGNNFIDIDFEISMKKGRVRLKKEDFDLHETGIEDGTSLYEGAFDKIKLICSLTSEPAGTSCVLELSSSGPLDCQSIALYLTYQEKGVDLSGRSVPCIGKEVAHAGLHLIGKKGSTQPDTRYCGLYQSSTDPCVFLGTKIPQKNIHLYQAELLQKDTVRFTCTTSFTVGQQKKSRLQSETTYVMAGKTPLTSLQDYARHVPLLPADRFAAPLVGWNSWDYYFAALSHEDIMENCRAIADDATLSEKMSCCVIDMGWEHREGDWYANYRFPQGMAFTAQEIEKNGLTPGIWTNGCQIQNLSYNALRQGPMLLKDQYGDALVVDGMYLIDPTHPDGAAHYKAVYTRLRQDGYRIFKVDFISALLYAVNFYDEESGPYDAIRVLLTIIREAVGDESHIIGCSYPPECGAGYTDSCRIGVDIHNQWGHVRWVLEYLQLSFWENGRLFRIDPDFLVVRGKETSLEQETNVYNPFAHAPQTEGTVGARWRRGEVFDRYEAETWARIVVFAGGNIISSDRISMLNTQGKELLYNHLDPLPATAVPLDLGDHGVASFWYTQDETQHHLLIINHEDDRRVAVFDFSRFGLAEPAMIQSSEGKARLTDGIIYVNLERHESSVVTW